MHLSGGQAEFFVCQGHICLQIDSSSSEQCQTTSTSHLRHFFTGVQSEIAKSSSSESHSFRFQIHFHRYTSSLHKTTPATTLALYYAISLIQVKGTKTIQVWREREPGRLQE